MENKEGHNNVKHLQYEFIKKNISLFVCWDSVDVYYSTCDIHDIASGRNPVNVRFSQIVIKCV